jgi:hypothetical protein
MSPKTAMPRPLFAASALLALALPVAAQHEIQQPKGPWQQPGDEVVLDSCKKGAEGS